MNNLELVKIALNLVQRTGTPRGWSYLSIFSAVYEVNKCELPTLLKESLAKEDCANILKRNFGKSEELAPIFKKIREEPHSREEDGENVSELTTKEKAKKIMKKAKAELELIFPSQSRIPTERLCKYVAYDEEIVWADELSQEIKKLLIDLRNGQKNQAKKGKSRLFNLLSEKPVKTGSPQRANLQKNKDFLDSSKMEEIYKETEHDEEEKDLSIVESQQLDSISTENSMLPSPSRNSKKKVCSKTNNPLKIQVEENQKENQKKRNLRPTISDLASIESSPTLKKKNKKNSQKNFQENKKNFLLDNKEKTTTPSSPKNIFSPFRSSNNNNNNNTTEQQYLDSDGRGSRFFLIGKKVIEVSPKGTKTVITEKNTNTLSRFLAFTTPVAERARKKI